MEEERNNNTYWVWIVPLVLGLVIGMYFFSDSKYEGQSAEEWFNSYDSVVGCVEDSDTIEEAHSCL